MRVLFLIPKNNPPELVGSEYHKNFKEFVSLCLNKDPEDRPTAHELMKHKFIKTAKKTSCLIELIEKYKRWKIKDANNDASSSSGDEDNKEEVTISRTFYQILTIQSYQS